MFDDLMQKGMGALQQAQNSVNAQAIINQGTVNFIVKLKGVGCVYRKFYKDGAKPEQVTADLKELFDLLVKKFGEKNLEKVV